MRKRKRWNKTPLFFSGSLLFDNTTTTKVFQLLWWISMSGTHDQYSVFKKIRGFTNFYKFSASYFMSATGFSLQTHSIHTRVYRWHSPTYAHALLLSLTQNRWLHPTPTSPQKSPNSQCKLQQLLPERPKPGSLARWEYRGLSPPPCLFPSASHSTWGALEYTRSTVACS